MVIEIIIILLVLMLLLIGFMYKDLTVLILGSILSLVVGVSIMVYGIEGIIINTFLQDTIALIFIGLGAYIFLRGTWEWYKND